MKNNYSIKKILILNSFLLCIGFGYAQTPIQKKEITKDYSLEKLKDLEVNFDKAFLTEYNKAVQLANLNGWPITFTDDKGSFHQIRKVLNGNPIYIKTFNTAAAISTRTDYLHNGGGLGLDIEGQGMTAHVWDAGLARVTHQEYDGTGGTDRYSVGDGSSALHYHSAHVAGTIIASGFSPNAKGMAPQASAIGYDWNSDLAEATTAAANGMLISNHSYGYDYTGLAGASSWIIGAYIQESKDWDDVMYNAPYYLMVVAAGNDGADELTNSDPLGGNAAYDKLSGQATSKNGLVVANGQDANINVDGTLNSVARNSSSSEGPTDDLRIKPDIMGNGTGLFSTYESADNAYASISGTSMASPNVAGSLLLLQQHHNNVNGAFMKAATLKGLALHTADDVGTAGPDANTGWGLMNTKAAAEAITTNGFGTWVSEEVLTNGGTFTMEIPAGNSFLSASISWTDQGGQINSSAIFNDSKAVLVNDLDIRVTQSTNTFMPWKLTGVDTNTQDDNTVDPYERVDIANPSGTYTITVTHKGTLTGGSQDFSLIITGLKSRFALNTQSDKDQIICSTNDVTYNFDYTQLGATTTSFTTSGVPAGATVNITPNSLSATGTFDVTLEDLDNVPAGNYVFSVIGDNGLETESRTIRLTVFHADFSTYPQSLSTPANGTNALPSIVSLAWAENLNAESYYVEVATNPSFSSLAFSGTVSDLSFDLSGLTSETVYYWRVRPNNSCGNGIFSETYSFQTGEKDCSPAAVTQTNDTTIDDLSVVTSTLNYPDSFTIGDVNITVDYSHTWIGDVSLTLVSPLGTRVTLIDVLTCTDQTNFNFNFDDEATNVIDCATGNTNYPSLETYKPVSPLSAFNGEAANGVWTLEISDEGPGDVGVLNEWTLNVCDIISATPPNFVNNGFTPILNGTYTFLSTDIEATSASETATQQMYTVVELPTVGILKMNSVAMNVGDTFTQDDVNTGKITYSNTETVVYDDQFIVDIQNAANGWLGNQAIIFNGTLSTNEFELGSISVWPNPAEEVINIRLNNISSTSNIAISLFDLQGRTIKNSSFNSNSNSFVKTINVNNLENGIYLLEVKQGNKKAIKKIIVNK